VIFLNLEKGRFCLGYNYYQQRITFASQDAKSHFMFNAKGSKYAGRTIRKSPPRERLFVYINNNDHRILVFKSPISDRASYEIIKKTRGGIISDFQILTGARVVTLTNDGVIALWTVGDDNYATHVNHDLKMRPHYQMGGIGEYFLAIAIDTTTDYFYVTSERDDFKQRISVLKVLPDQTVYEVSSSILDNKENRFNTIIFTGKLEAFPIIFGIGEGFRQLDLMFFDMLENVEVIKSENIRSAGLTGTPTRFSWDENGAIWATDSKGVIVKITYSEITKE